MERTGTVQAVDRALALLEILAAHPEGARLTLVAGKAGLAPSTTHRLLTTLERRGFAQFDVLTSHWVVGRRAFAVGIAFTRWQSFIAAAMPFLRKLRDHSRETANLGILEGGEVITVTQVESREIVRAIAVPGGRAPVMSSGMGKAIAATWPDAAIVDFVGRHGLHPMTRHSLRSIPDVMAEIRAIRARGYAFDDEEFAYGMRCAAAVVWNPFAEPIGAISISALASRLPQAAMAAMGETVRDVAQELTAVMGGTMLPLSAAGPAQAGDAPALPADPDAADREGSGEP